VTKYLISGNLTNILPGTIIDLTDNGWERINTGRWGDTEGFIRLIRKGSSIAKGVIITLSIDDNGDCSIISPDTLWEIEDLNPSYNFNLNASGDQFFFLQGGEWLNGNGAYEGGWHDATYQGRVLCAFNNTMEWLSEHNSQSSALIDGMQCFCLTQESSNCAYMKYIGNIDSSIQRSHLIHIHQHNNWYCYNSCEHYNDSIADWQIIPVIPIISDSLNVNYDWYGNIDKDWFNSRTHPKAVRQQGKKQDKNHYKHGLIP